jgi:hypothetical protein
MWQLFEQFTGSKQVVEGWGWFHGAPAFQVAGTISIRGISARVYGVLRYAAPSSLCSPELGLHLYRLFFHFLLEKRKFAKKTVKNFVFLDGPFGPKFCWR